MEEDSDNEFTSDTYSEWLSRSTQEAAWYNSGGGFSSFFDRPSWQKDAINNYFNSYDTLLNNDKSLETKRFNADGRRFPDLSAQSVNYVICDGMYIIIYLYVP